jgi:hypothetical protein
MKHNQPLLLLLLFVGTELLMFIFEVESSKVGEEEGLFQFWGIRVLK